MDGNYMNISNVEDFFNTLLQGADKVSENVYFRIPSTMPTNVNDFVVVDCGSAIEDMNAYGSGIVTVYMYAKSIGDEGQKDLYKLSEMETKLLQLVNESNDEHYRIYRYNTYSDYDDTLSMFCNIVMVRITIV